MELQSGTKIAAHAGFQSTVPYTHTSVPKAIKQRKTSDFLSFAAVINGKVKHNLTCKVRLVIVLKT